MLSRCLSCDDDEVPSNSDSPSCCQRNRNASGKKSSEGVGEGDAFLYPRPHFSFSSILMLYLYAYLYVYLYWHLYLLLQFFFFFFFFICESVEGRVGGWLHSIIQDCTLQSFFFSVFSVLLHQQCSIVAPIVQYCCTNSAVLLH